MSALKGAIFVYFYILIIWFLSFYFLIISLNKLMHNYCNWNIMEAVYFYNSLTEINHCFKINK